MDISFGMLVHSSLKAKRSEGPHCQVELYNYRASEVHAEEFDRGLFSHSRGYVDTVLVKLH